MTAPTPEAARLRTSREHWAVMVERNGENILTIDQNCLSGRELSAEDLDTIRKAARHLLAFAGEGPG